MEAAETGSSCVPSGSEKGSTTAAAGRGDALMFPTLTLTERDAEKGREAGCTAGVTAGGAAGGAAGSKTAGGMPSGGDAAAAGAAAAAAEAATATVAPAVAAAAAAAEAAAAATTSSRDRATGPETKLSPKPPGLGGESIWQEGREHEGREHEEVHDFTPPSSPGPPTLYLANACEFGESGQ